MAITDFIYYGNSGANQFGELVEHSSLENPLSSDFGGQYCKKMIMPNTSAYEGIYLNLDGFYSVPDSKAVSLSAWFRMGNSKAKPGLFAKSYNYYTGFRYDYGLFIYDSSTIKFSNADYDNPYAETLEGQWVKLKLDIIPIRNTDGVAVGDRLIGSIGRIENGSLVWAQLDDLFLEKIVPAGITSKYVANDNSQYKYYGYAQPYPASTNGAGGIWYVDNFKMIVQDL